MHPFLSELFLEGKPVITDGAWGTQLQGLGLNPGEIPDIWNITNPEKVFQVAKSYVDAGSRIILTNTFGANKFRLAEAKEFADKVKEINRLGVEISLSAAKNKAYVFGSIGPSGKILMMGDVTADELLFAYREQAEAIADGGAHGIVIETMSDVEEAVIAVRAAKHTGLPVIACMVFDSGKDKDRTMMGNTPEEVSKKLIDAGADIIGSNCGQGIETFLRISRRLSESSSNPVWIKPNAGLPQVIDGKPVYNISPQEFSKYVPELIESGAGFIGGCCGTTPDFIVEIRKMITNNSTGR